MRRRPTKRQIAGSMCILAAVAAAGYWWSPHVWWAYIVARNHVTIPSVPVAELKAPGKTEGWYDCRIGPLSLKLPPELIEKADSSTAKSTIEFKGRDVELSIHIPYKVPETSRDSLALIASELKLSPTRLIAESYRASTDDFRWTMSHRALRRHQILLSLVGLFPHGMATSVETQFGASLEGILVIDDRTMAAFQWRSTSGIAAGGLTCTGPTNELDLGMVRDICHSLSCDETRLGPEYSKKDLMEM